MKMETYNKADYQTPLYETFQEMLQGMAAFGDQPALSWYTRRKEACGYTYRELTDRVRALREALCARGLAGKHIAIVSENTADWLTAFLAAVSCGCAAVCVDVEQPDKGIREMICRADARTVFLSAPFLPICQPLSDEGEVDDLVLLGDDPDDAALSITGLCLEGRANLDQGIDHAGQLQVRGDQTAEIVFTSGTTMRSKMVMLSQQAVMQNLHDSALNVRLSPKVFCSLPFYHAYGLNSAVMSAFLRGLHLTINGDLRTTMRDIQLARPGTMLTVPLLLEAIHNQIWLEAERAGKAGSLRKMLRLSAAGQKIGLHLYEKKREEIRKKALGDMEIIISGGAHLSEEISEEFELLGVQILQGYGITECCPLISVNCNYANKLGSVGLLLESYEMKLVDGEVWVKGPCVMQGYYKEPEQTAETFEDGWFKTGDLGYQDADGFLFLTGRKKNLIVFKNGKKISPEKLENALGAIPIIREVVVYGSTSGSSADDVKLTASVFPDPDLTEGMEPYEILNTVQKEINKLNANLPTYQQIQMITIRDKEFSKTGTRKIKRYEE